MCGKTMKTKKEKTEHMKKCDGCRQILRSIRTKNVQEAWKKDRDGIIMKMRENSPHIGRPPKPGGHTTRCELILRTLAERKEHQATCPECIERRKQIRSETMSRNWRDHGTSMREAASSTAKRTSARQDVQQARADRLRAWRKREPERFRKECTERMLASNAAGQNRSTTSCLEDTISGLLPTFRRNAQVRTSSIVRQVDFVGTFMVEVDGLHHFGPLYGEVRFEDTRSRDKILTRWATESGRTLVRISIDCFTSSGSLRPLWKETVELILKDPPDGVSLVGDLYASIDLPWDRWWTSKSGEIICSSSGTD